MQNNYVKKRIIEYIKQHNTFPPFSLVMSVFLDYFKERSKELVGQLENVNAIIRDLKKYLNGDRYCGE